MSLRRTIGNIVIYAFLVLAFVTFIFPFYLLIINSFKSNLEIFENPFAIPTSFSFDSIFKVIQTMDFITTFSNTLMITVFSVVLTLIFSAMCAHYLVRNNTLFNNSFFAILVASMIIPFQSLMIPLIQIYGANLGLIDLVPRFLLILLYIGFGSAFSVFIYHGFIKSIPLELEEASLIDGCTRKQTFFLIVMPMLLPTSVTIAILNTLWIWNDYLLPNLVLQKPEVLTMPLKMKQYSGEYMDDLSLIIPAMLLTILPLLIAYLVGQKYIIAGVMQGAIK